MTEAEQPKRRKPATGPQLWRLNQLGLLREAIEEDGRAWADTCHRLIAEALIEE